MFSFSGGEDKHLIVFDLEWNQNSYAPNHRMPHEIIEIGERKIGRERPRRKLRETAVNGIGAGLKRGKRRFEVAGGR